MKLLPIVLFAIGALVLLMAVMRYSSIKKYNRKYRRRRKPRKVDSLTILMFPVAAALLLAAVMTMGAGEKAPAGQENKPAQQTQENQEPTTEPESDGGWIEENGKKYYQDENGAKVTGWLELAGKQYYFGYGGALCTDTTEEINGVIYSADASGVLTPIGGDDGC